MRITSTSTYISMRESLSTSLQRVVDTQSQLGTMRRINKASDDPVGAATALRYRAYESQQDAFDLSASNAKTWLGQADTHLQNITTSLAAARGLAISATNQSMSAEGRLALGQQITAIRDEIATSMNQQQEGQALFGGFQEKAVAQAADGTWSYVGDAGVVQRRVGDGVLVAANVSGYTAFGFDQGPGNDVLSVLDRLAAAATSGDTAALTSNQDQLQVRTRSVLGALGIVGATTNRVESAQARGRQYLEQITAERSSIEDIDIAETVLQLNSAKTGYEAALGAVAKANLPSLANFLN